MDSDEPFRVDEPLVLLGLQDLDPLSVAELTTRVATLQAEIERCRTHLDRAIGHRASADSIFKR